MQKLQETNLLTTVLKEMNHQFSSKEFCKEFRRRGGNPRAIQDGHINAFLLTNTSKLTARTWSKVTSKKNPMDQFSDSEIIQELKSRGYIVQKQVITYETL